ncbi:MAG: class I SAM-dependent methyltransferase, partial [Verrucomicrobiota bacterium]
MDIGTGAGHFALAAKHVYAIEPNPIMEMAERLAADNGLKFVHRYSTKFELPQKPDVTFSDFASA